MNKPFVILVLSFVLVVGCKSNHHISLDQVITSLEENQLGLEKKFIGFNSYFTMRLNGIRPALYEINENLVSIYIFSSQKESDEGLFEFQKNTEAVNLASFKSYQNKNVLVFFVYEFDKRSTIPEEQKLESAIMKLDNH